MCACVGPARTVRARRRPSPSLEPSLGRSLSRVRGMIIFYLEKHCIPSSHSDSDRTTGLSQVCSMRGHRTREYHKGPPTPPMLAILAAAEAQSMAAKLRLRWQHSLPTCTRPRHGCRMRPLSCSRPVAKRQASYEPAPPRWCCSGRSSYMAVARDQLREQRSSIRATMAARASREG